MWGRQAINKHMVSRQVLLVSGTLIKQDEVSNEGSRNYGVPSFFVNKDVLECSYAHSFTNCFCTWMLLHENSRVQSCDANGIAYCARFKKYNVLL